jgi:hypothetical protein
MKCTKCKGKVLVDRQFSTSEHLEVYCIICGKRKFYHPPDSSKEGSWLLSQEKTRAKTTIAPL